MAYQVAHGIQGYRTVDSGGINMLSVTPWDLHYWIPSMSTIFILYRVNSIDFISSGSQGKLKYNEQVTEGFDKMFDAFAGLFTGENLGKAVVKAWTLIG